MLSVSSIVIDFICENSKLDGKLIHFTHSLSLYLHYYFSSQRVLNTREKMFTTEKSNVKKLPTKLAKENGNIRLIIDLFAQKYVSKMCYIYNELAILLLYSSNHISHHSQNPKNKLLVYQHTFGYFQDNRHSHAHTHLHTHPKTQTSDIFKSP